MLEQRVGRLEEDMKEVKGRLSSIELLLAEIKGQLSQMPKTADFGSLRAEMSEIKGRLANLPTTWTLISFAIGSCLASAGLAFTIARLIK